MPNSCQLYHGSRYHLWFFQAVGLNKLAALWVVVTVVVRTAGLSNLCPEGGQFVVQRNHLSYSVSSGQKKMGRGNKLLRKSY